MTKGSSVGALKSFRTKYSLLTEEQKREMENWGHSKDGFIGGGNFDDDP
jgi:hypothetical protein